MGGRRDFERPVWNTGHLYFTLKDGASQIKAVMFRSAVRYLKFKPEDGLKVVARGKISVYDPKGEYQIVCEHMEPQGLGSLQLAFEQLKKKLAAEGLFDRARKRPLPALPRRIGIVTSIDGAALRDIIRVLRRRYPNAHLVISPTRVQGEGAAGEIAHAMRKIARIEAVDVVIVARGGGSLEDLWAFNEKCWRARSPRRRCRSSRGSATRPTSRSPISSPTCARRRRRRPPSWWSGARTSSSATSTASASGSTRRCIIACGAWNRACTLLGAARVTRASRTAGDARPSCLRAGVARCGSDARRVAARRTPRCCAALARSVRSAPSARRGSHAAGRARWPLQAASAAPHGGRRRGSARWRHASTG